MKKLCMVIIAIVLAAPLAASAKDITFTSGITQSLFNDFSKGFGSAIGYRNLAPATPLGITGFDVAAEISAISIKKESDAWENAFGGNAPDFLAYPRLRARKGLPLGIDVGAMYTYVPATNVKLYGAEVSMALLEGGIAMPALGVRGTYTRLAGVQELDMQTAGIDASISKGFAILTPYVGGGMLWIDSKPKGNIATALSLKDEKVWTPRGFAGLKLTVFPLVSVTAEVEYAALPIYSLKAGISF